MKKLWKTLNLLMPNSKASGSPTIEINGKSDFHDVANEFNEMFCTVGSRLADLIDDVNVDLLPEIVGNGNIFELHNVRPEFVSKELSSVNATKATGLDGINARFLRLSHAYISQPITHIINTSLATAAFPLDWKIAKVTPLFKEGSRNDVNNYRPISVLPILGKFWSALFTTNCIVFSLKTIYLTQANQAFALDIQPQLAPPWS